MATIAEVAARAGVSAMTVSRYLSGKARVSEETGKRIQEAVDALDYRPNQLARGLSGGTMDVIAYVMPNISDPYFSDVIEGIENVCDEKEYSVLICSVKEQPQLQRFLDMIIERKCAGAVFHHLNMKEDQIRFLEERGIRTMLIDNETRIDGYSLDNDNYYGGAMAARFLVEQGYRKISMIRGLRGFEAETIRGGYYAETFQAQIWLERRAGFLAGLTEAGIELLSEYGARGSAGMQDSFEDGQRVARLILAERERPEAVYCSNDLLALGVLSELLEQKVEVPEQMALIGHDGLRYSRVLYPRITTVHQPQTQLGQQAAKRLLDRIAGTPIQQHAVFPSEIFIGNTT